MRFCSSCGVPAGDLFGQRVDEIVQRRPPPPSAAEPSGDSPSRRIRTFVQWGGGLALVLLFFGFVGVLDSGGGDSTSSPDATTSTQGIKTGFTGVTYSVGDMDISFSPASRYNSLQHNQFNEEDTRIRVTTSAVRGDYRLARSAFSIIDANGVVHSPSFCSGCPDELDSTEMIRGGHVSGYLYFDLPGGASSARKIRYEPLFSSNSITISLPTVR